MASQTTTTTTLVDDMDGTKASETLTFALAGKTYEIDLSKANANKLRKALEPYVSAGREVRRTRTRAATTSRGGRHTRDETAKIKAWGRKNGFEVADRGRLSRALLDAYAAKH